MRAVRSQHRHHVTRILRDPPVATLGLTQTKKLTLGSLGSLGSLGFLGFLGSLRSLEPLERRDHRPPVIIVHGLAGDAEPDVLGGQVQTRPVHADDAAHRLAGP